MLLLTSNAINLNQYLAQMYLSFDTSQVRLQMPALTGCMTCPRPMRKTKQGQRNITTLNTRSSKK